MLFDFFKGFHFCIIQDNKCNKSPVSMCLCAQSCQIPVTPWTVVHQAPLFMGQDTGVGCIGRWIPYHWMTWKPFY